MIRARTRMLAPAVLVATLALCASPAPAQAFDPTKPICTLAGLVSGLAGKVCSAARHAGTVLKAGQKLLGGHLGSAAETLSGGGAATKAISATAAFTAMAFWVVGGAKLVLHETAAVISSTTRPQLQSTWFASSYWRMAAISALLTLPFLFASAIQALVRSDVSLLARSALGYLPLSALAVAIAGPLTQLLLAASDELSGLVSSASGYPSAGFAHVTGVGIGASFVSTFPLFFVGLLAVVATVTLWLELLIRSAAVYVIVLMLPLFFAALVWPARRIWAVRAIELLLALILSKFAIVAVLALGGAALGHTAIPSLTQMLAGTTLVMMAALTPWALLRLLPLHELAAGVEGMSGAGTRGLATADSGATNAYHSTEAFREEHVEGRDRRPAGDAGGPSGARSAIEGLNAGQERAAADPPGEPNDRGESTEPGRPRPEASAPPTAPTASTQPTAPTAPDPEPGPVSESFSETAPVEDLKPVPGMDQPWVRESPFEIGPGGVDDAALNPAGAPGSAPNDDPEPR